LKPNIYILFGLKMGAYKLLRNFKWIVRDKVNRKSRRRRKGEDNKRTNTAIHFHNLKVIL
jgi:hypothetical protein